MRFDDSLRTVLAADTTSEFGARAAFRQLADLVARRRVPPDGAILERLRILRDGVPAEVRASVARSVAIDAPPGALVGLLADDEPAVASAVLREAALENDEWIGILPGIGPAGRAVLRRRPDLSAEVRRALDSFGSTDFALSYHAPENALPVAADQPVARDDHDPAEAAPVPIMRPAEHVPDAAPGNSGFRIADLVDRIAAFQRDREATGDVDEVARPIGGFQFETDARGVIRWVDAAPRGAIVGLSLTVMTGDAVSSVDGVAAGAFARRTRFSDARMTIGGASALAGDWRISGVPLFDHATGRFTGFRGAARRPRVDESAARPRGDAGGSEGLRRLVHELRTPTNAIAGFSELIESQLLGPVAPAYRERAATIRTQAADLVAAIEDLDLAARIDGHALDLRPGEVSVVPLLRRTIDDLAPLARLRGSEVAIEAPGEDVSVGCDDHALERLLARLSATMISAAGVNERIGIAVTHHPGEMVAVSFTRPRALASLADSDLLRLDAEREADLPGAPLLGTGFALRLARNLAAELGGSLTFGDDLLTLRLPAAWLGTMGQSSTN